MSNSNAMKYAKQNINNHNNKIPIQQKITPLVRPNPYSYKERVDTPCYNKTLPTWSTFHLSDFEIPTMDNSPIYIRPASPIPQKMERNIPPQDLGISSQTSNSQEGKGIFDKIWDFFRY